MSQTRLISVDEYLASSYEPDCDYVDGCLEDRNSGEFDHSRVQTAVAAYFFLRRKQWGCAVGIATRIWVSRKRIRVADVCIVLGDPGEQILTRPPFLCIEILSPEDRMKRVQERIDDYLAMGVKYVWVIDPSNRHVYIATPEAGLQEFRGAVLRTADPVLELPLEELFE